MGEGDRGIKKRQGLKVFFLFLFFAVLTDSFPFQRSLVRSPSRPMLTLKRRTFNEITFFFFWIMLILNGAARACEFI